MEISWEEIIKIAATSSISTVMITQSIEWIRQRQKRKSSASVFAIKIANKLEGFVQDCERHATANRYAECPPGEQYPDWNTEIPLPPEITEQIDWSILDKSLVDKLHNLENRARASKDVVLLAGEHSYDDLDVVLVEQAAERGLEAWHLAVELRRRYGIANSEFIEGYAIDLHKYLEWVEQRNLEIKERSERFLEDMKKRSGFDSQE